MVYNDLLFSYKGGWFFKDILFLMSVEIFTERCTVLYVGT